MPDNRVLSGSGTRLEGFLRGNKRDTASNALQSRKVAQPRKADEATPREDVLA